MRIVVCAKEVLDPDGVNAYAVSGRLAIAEDGKTIAVAGIGRLMNGYDEQAIEAALRLRDAGLECTIAVVALGAESSNFLRRAAAMGADELVLIDARGRNLDAIGVGLALAAFIGSSGGADLVLCGRQGSDFDQGIVSGVIAEKLGLPLVTLARDLSLGAGGALRVTRAHPAGNELVECRLPAVVTITSELGQPREPGPAGMIAARRKKPSVLSIDELGLDGADLEPRMTLDRLVVPKHQESCERIAGSSPADAAVKLMQTLRVERLVT